MPGDESVPLLSAYFPPPHCVQLSSPSPPPIPILFPAGHAVQYEDEGTLAEYFPTGQSVCCDAPKVTATPLPLDAYLPAATSTQTDVAPGPVTNLPSSHCWQPTISDCVTPSPKSSWYFPAGHI